MYMYTAIAKVEFKLQLSYTVVHHNFKGIIKAELDQLLTAKQEYM